MTWLLSLAPALLNLVTSWQAKARDAQVQMYVAQTGATAQVAQAAIAAQAQVQTRWWFAALPPALIGFSIAVYVVKAVVYDKVIGSLVGCSGHPPVGTCTTFATDAMSGDLRWVFTTVIASYFGYEMVKLLKR